MTLTSTVTVDDHHNGTTTQDEIITITGTDDAPMINSAAVNQTIAETDAALTASGTVGFSDVDTGDTPSATVTAQTVTSGGITLTNAQIDTLKNAFTIDPAGTWSFNLASPDFLAFGQSMTLTSTVTVDDHHNGTTTQDEIITITGTDDAPMINSAAVNQTIAESDAALAASGSVSFSDVDTGDTPSATVTGKRHRGGITLTGAQIDALKNAFTIDTAGNWSFNLASPDFLAFGQSMTLTSTVTVDDHHNGTTTQDEIITITGTDDAPMINSAAVNQTIAETDAALAASGSVSFSDVDTGDTPSATVTAQTVTSGGITLTNAQIDTLKNAFTIDPAGTWSFNLASPDFLGAGQSMTLTSTVTVDDHHNGTTTQDEIITITGTDDAPMINSAAVNQTIAETDAALAASGSVSFSDVDTGDTPAATLTGQSVTASGITLTGAQIAALENAFTIDTAGNWSFNLASPDFLAAGQSMTLTSTVTVNDHHGGTVTQDEIITITGTDDAPTINSAAVNQTIAETDATLTASGTVSFSDADTGDTPALSLTTQSVTSSGITLTGTETTALENAFTIDAGGHWTFNLASPDFLGAGQSMTLTSTVTVDDHHGGTTIQDEIVTITGSNDAPVLANVAASAAYPPGSLPVVLSPGLTISDVDNTTLSGATVTISSATTFLGDQLGVNLPTLGGVFVGTSISATYNPANATLTLTGADTLANYEQVLEHVTFSSNNATPTNGGLGATRTIEWQVNDGSSTNNLSAVSAATETVIHLHTLDLDTTAAGFDSTTTYTEHGSPLPIVNNNDAIADPDSNSMTSAIVTLTNAQAGDQLALGTLPSTIHGTVDTSHSGEIIVTLSPVGSSASTADYRAALQQVLYSSTSSNIDVTPRNVTVVVTDSLHVQTNAAVVTISLIPVNDPPTVDAHGGSLSYTENDAPTAIDPLFTLTDPDSANINSATVQITGNFHAGEDVLGFTSQNGITGSYDAATGLLTLSGASSIGNYEAALEIRHLFQLQRQSFGADQDHQLPGRR